MDESKTEKTENLVQDQQGQTKFLGLIIGEIIHNFNNAIGLIRGYAELSLGDVDSNGRTHAYLKNVVDGANTVSELSEKMKMFARQEKQNLKPMHIHSIVEDAVNSLVDSAKIQKNIDQTCGAILADVDQMRQIVINLCSNACDAVSNSDGKIEVTLNEVDVDVSLARAHRRLKEGRHLKLTVDDTGCGIDEKIQEKIFEPFFTTKGEGCVGIGLTVVKGIVKNHSGVIAVESKLGEGTKVDVYLPLAE